ncbi:ABC transporter permease [Asaia krungthepensis]|uniref:Inner-membrane translocator n=1 Tax=Asaia krungthepensis NRIC 0535 TaxID=1307925 RepID=A0ABQ0Q527_9PROT|nr:ABC transporter permease [Asaia krungthepensis]GBQ91793.1 inner-membrane translocator [Asaia krungthepensis NRIC 0535]
MSRRTRLAVVPARRIMIGRALALCAVAVVLAIVLVLLGLPLGMVCGLVLKSTFGTVFGLENLALYMTPLLMTGAAVWLALRAGLWNIGAEGQFLAGATAAAAVGLFAPLPAPVALPVAMLASLVAGGAWSAVPAAGRAWLGVSEIITTLLLNFIATYLVYYLVTGPWADHVTDAQVSSQRMMLALPSVYSVVHWGGPVALALVVALGALLKRSRFGYELSLCGSNPDSARYAGIRVAPRLFTALVASGALAGLGGMMEVLGTVHRLQGGLAHGYGYLGIVVALLARQSAYALIPAAFLMAVILNTGIVLQTLQVSASSVLAITGLLVFAVAVSDELAAYVRLETKS